MPIDLSASNDPEKSINSQVPDYELADRIVITAPAELRAISDPLRATLLDLLQERAATVSELATAVGRPRSTVAHHVNVLLDAGLLKVVRTRKVRAIDERFYGRTARTFFMGPLTPEQYDPPPWRNDIVTAGEESMPAYAADRMYALHRHARISRSQAREFWERVFAVADEFAQLPRAGEEVYGFVVGLYPTEHPTLPDAGEAATS